uniref:Putative ovule protein n=1 Tax=Solanum chacoense TaxID=4108 RepID=A0A0V0GXN1_SOLCH
MPARKVRTSEVDDTSENASLEEGQVGSFKLKAESQLCPADKRSRVKQIISKNGQWRWASLGTRG